MSNLKIGDKIKIQKEEKNKELEDTFNDILLALKTNKLNQSEKLKWCGTALEILELWFKEDELKSVKVAKRKLIPILEELVVKGSLDKMALFFDFYKRAYCFCARRDFECFVDYIEWNQPKKVLANRREVLKPYVGDLIVTPKEVDQIIDNVSKIIANGINGAVHNTMENLKA